MGIEYLIWYGSLALFFIGLFFFKYFYKHKTYFIPYLLVQLGMTLLVASIFIIGGWAGMGYAIMSLWIIGLGLIIWLIVFIYSLIKKK